MTLEDFLKPPGAAADLARKLNCTPVLVSQWRSGARVPPVARCIDIERATGGAVRCEDLRADVDWGYLRASKPAGDKGMKRPARAI